MNDFFRWDHLKDLSNRAKHGVGFHEASSVFYDDHARLMTDPDHSAQEDRFVILGMSSSLRILVVVHSYRQPRLSHSHYLSTKSHQVRG